MRQENRPYITNEAWQRRAGRADAIDDVADQFERPAGAEQFWSSAGSRRSVVSMREWSARRSMPVAAEVHRDVANG